MQIYICLGVTVLALLLMLTIPWRSLGRRRTLLPSDIALPFAPAVFILFGLAFLNDATDVGWGGILYPAIAILPGAILLNARAFLLTRLRVSPWKISASLLVAESVAAFIFGGMLPPLYS